MEIGARGTLAPAGTPVDAYRSVADGRSGDPSFRSRPHRGRLGDERAVLRPASRDALRLPLLAEAVA